MSNRDDDLMIRLSISSNRIAFWTGIFSIFIATIAFIHSVYAEDKREKDIERHVQVEFITKKETKKFQGPKIQDAFIIKEVDTYDAGIEIMPSLLIEEIDEDQPLPDIDPELYKTDWDKYDSEDIPPEK